MSSDGTQVVVQKKGVPYFILEVALHTILLIFSVLAFIRKVWNKASYRFASSSGYHHRSPQLIRNDVLKLSKIPAHIAVILNLRPLNSERGGIEGLLYDAGEIANWCIGVGSKELTIYERSGALKNLPMQDVVRHIKERLVAYYGVDGIPTFTVHRDTLQFKHAGSATEFHLNLLSESDGRPALVKLTSELISQVKQNTLSPDDINIDFLDQKMRDIVGGEPDLLIMFTPHVDLQGYPPWQIRVSELFYLPNYDKVSYLVFKRALGKFANAKINLGK